jgi:hypothetical protein
MTTEAKTNIALTAFCGDLRSKKFYMLDRLPTEAADFYAPSGHCWCYHTQQPVGPDGELVMPERCGPNRKCYRSALAPPGAPPQL